VVNLDIELLTDEASGTLSTEQVLGADILNHIAIQALQVDLNGVVGVGAIILETNNGPWALDLCTSLFNFIQEDTLDLTLVNEGGERIAGVNEAGATGPAASAANTGSVGLGVPESNIIDLGRFVGHDRALQTKVTQDLG
jgi:hypothetical protein